jgi:hypothetical protein
LGSVSIAIESFDDRYLMTGVSDRRILESPSHVRRSFQAPKRATIEGLVMIRHSWGNENQFCAFLLGIGLPSFFAMAAVSVP